MFPLLFLAEIIVGDSVKQKLLDIVIEVDKLDFSFGELNFEAELEVLGLLDFPTLSKLLTLKLLFLFVSGESDSEPSGLSTGSGPSISTGLNIKMSFSLISPDFTRPVTMVPFVEYTW